MKINFLKAGILPAAFAGMLGLFSCSDDFEVTAPYKDITVVYGILNVDDTAHYIRIQKAFLDENKNALDLAKVADSNFFQNLDVSLLEINGTSKVLVDNLTRVDLNAEGYQKGEGVFFDGPSWAYKTKYVLNPARQYELRAVNTATGDTIHAKTTVLSTDKDDFEAEPFLSVTYQFNFKYSNVNDEYKVNVYRVPASTAVIEGIIRFNYLDTNIVTNEATRRSVDYKFAQLSSTAATAELKNSKASFYSFLSTAIGPPPNEQTQRLIGNCDFIVWVANKDFANYLFFANNNGGITADQIQSQFTNIKGDNVLGLFAGRGKRSASRRIDDATLEALKSNPSTSGLKIAGRANF